MGQRQRTEDSHAVYSGGGASGWARSAAPALWRHGNVHANDRPLEQAHASSVNEQLNARIFDLEREIAAMRKTLDAQERRIRSERMTNEVLQREIEENYGVLSQIKGDIKILEDIARIDPVSTHRIGSTLQRRLTHLRTRSDLLEVSKLTESFIDILRREYPALTDAELQIVSFLRTGYTTGAIATTCCISERTVENHRLRIRRKLALPKDEPLPGYLQMLDEHTSRVSVK